MGDVMIACDEVESGSFSNGYSKAGTFFLEVINRLSRHDFFLFNQCFYISQCELCHHSRLCFSDEY